MKKILIKIIQFLEEFEKKDDTTQKEYFRRLNMIPGINVIIEEERIDQVKRLG